MRKAFSVIVLLCGLVAAVTAQTKEIAEWAIESPQQKEERMGWWLHDRFGMFIHWGLYSVPARHEWVQSRERIPANTYKDNYFDLFDPDLYDPKEWVTYAKAAGMKYVVITTRHHEGFSLWDTEFSAFKASNTPAKRDLLKPFVDACREGGLKVGFYFSLIDWHHPDFTIDRLHPLRDVEGADTLNHEKDMNRFRLFLKNQLTELLTNYGKIDLLFFDYSYPGKRGKGHSDWDSEGLLKLARTLQPQILVNDRLDLHDKPWGWDYVTPEQFIPVAWPERNGSKVPWETCQTFSGSWGYHRDEHTWKSDHQIISMLVEVVSKGGNLLLNVGPTSRGEFDARAIEKLTAVGRWMRYNQQAIYGCTSAPSEYVKPQSCLLTYNPAKKRLYIHLLQWPFKTLYLPNYQGKFKHARFLHDGSEIKYTTRSSATANEHGKATAGENDVILELPTIKPLNIEIPVIELIIE